MSNYYAQNPSKACTEEYDSLVEDVKTLEESLEFHEELQERQTDIDTVLTTLDSCEDELESLNAEIAALQAQAANSPQVVPTAPIELGLIVHLLPENFFVGNIWNDVSGSNNHFTPQGFPQFSASWTNGEPSVVFDGASDYFVRSGMPDLFSGLFNRHTIFMAFESSNLATGQGLFLAGDSGQTQYHYNRISGVGGTMSFARNNGMALLASNVDSGATVFSDPCIFSERQIGSTDFQYQVLGTKSTISGQLQLSGTITEWTLGRALLEFFEGDIGEILVYDRALSDLEVSIVTSYLSNKFSINIPAS